MLELLLTTTQRKANYSWALLNGLPIKCRGAAVAIVNGKLYSFGGTREKEGNETNNEFSYSDTMITYDLETGESVRGTMPILGRNSAQICSYGNNVYVMGGFHSITPGDFQLREFNTITGTWAGRIALSSTYAVNNLITHGEFIYATYYDLTNRRTVLARWNPNAPTNNWVTLAPFPAINYNNGVIVGYGNYIYYIGGRDGGTTTNIVYRYNISSNNWSILNTIPLEFNDVVAVNAVDKIYLIKRSTVNPPMLYLFTENQTPTLVTTADGGIQPTTASGVAVRGNTIYLVGGISSVAPTGLTNQVAAVTV